MRPLGGVRTARSPARVGPAHWVTGPFPLREEYGKLFDFVNAKKLNIKNRGLKEVSGRAWEEPRLLSLSGKGLGLVRLLFHSFFSSRPCRKKRCVRPSPLRVQVSWHDLRAGSAAPQGPPGGRAREGLGLTGSPGSRADALRRAVCGHAVLGLQAWLLPAAHRHGDSFRGCGVGGWP